MIRCPLLGTRLTQDCFLDYGGSSKNPPQMILVTAICGNRTYVLSSRLMLIARQLTPPSSDPFPDCAGVEVIMTVVPF